MSLRRRGACAPVVPFCPLAVAAGFVGLLAFPCPSRAAIVVNEVLYDPEGPDAGREFVELINTGPFATTLAGLTVEAGNGSDPGDWKVLWRGRGDRAIPPGGLYRIGVPGPGPGEEAGLDLQNGPDAVRLCKNGFPLDKLGYGAPLDPDLFEGRPAPAAKSGSSLARRLDGIDTGDNEADFESTTPSPGRPNRPEEDWSIRWSAYAPQRPAVGAEVIARLAVTNRGRAARPAPDVDVLEATADPLGAQSGIGSLLVGFGEMVEPGERCERTVILASPSDPGRQDWIARARRRDPVPENDADTLRLGIGPPPVRVTEVMAKPRADGCEWIEVAFAAADTAFAGGMRVAVREREIRSRVAPAHLLPLAREAEEIVAILAEDSLRMRTAHPELDPARLLAYDGTWPRLRNDAGDGGVADTIRLLDPRGIVLDAAMPGEAPAAGMSLERWGAASPESPSGWCVCPETSGSTPGTVRKRGSDAIARDGELSVRPRILVPGVERCEIEAEIGSDPATVDLRILDLHGATLRCLQNGLRMAGRLVSFWDGNDEQARPARPGLYVVVLRLTRSGKDEKAVRAAIAIAPTAGASR